MNEGFKNERQERISNFLSKIAESCDAIPNDELESYISELCDIYSDRNFRHSYSEISLALEAYRPDERDAICQKIMQIAKCSKNWISRTYPDPNDQTNILQKIVKLADHVNLECLRLGRIDRVEFIGKKATDELTAADGKLKETEGRANELSKRVSDFHAQSITILGIFAGLVVTFSTVSQFLTSSLSNLSNVAVQNIVLFISLSFFFLFNIIFLLMYCISKISGKSIASNCKRSNCEDCKSCKFNICRLWRKYPYVFWFNCLGVIFCGFLCYIAS